MLNIGTGARKNAVAGSVVVTDVRELREVLLYAETHSKKFRIVYKPLTPGADRDAEFAAVCQLVMLFKNIVFMVDEVWRYTLASWAPWELKELTYAGRHYGCTLLYTAQTTAEIAKAVLRVASRYFIFRIENGLDHDNLRKTCGVPDDVLRRISSLPDRHYFERDERQRWFYRRPI